MDPPKARELPKPFFRSGHLGRLTSKKVPRQGAKIPKVVNSPVARVYKMYGRASRLFTSIACTSWSEASEEPKPKTKGIETRSVMVVWFPG